MLQPKCPHERFVVQNVNVNGRTVRVCAACGKTKPRLRLLDLFCGAGGCSVGYERAGFDVVGVDIESQPNYPFELFHRGDALTALRTLIDTGFFFGREFAAVHASPPCQAHSKIAKQQRQRFPGAFDHPDLVGETRELLEATGLPFVIENVEGAPMPNAITLCGSSFGLDVQRHRLFECSFPILAPPCAHYWQTPRFPTSDKRNTGLTTVVGVYGHLDYAGEQQIREAAMGINWMSPQELTQAIPPAYTEFIGQQLAAHINAERIAA